MNATEFEIVVKMLESNEEGFYIKNDDNGKKVSIEYMAGGKFLCIDADGEPAKQTDDPCVAAAWLLKPEKEKADKIFTRDEAALIVELFEDVLASNGISVPSPEDDERDPDDDEGLYGSTYGDLLDNVEQRIISILKNHRANTEVITDYFSGNC